MDAWGAAPTGDEPVDPFHGRLGVGTGPLGSGPPGSAPRGTTIVGGQSGPRRRCARKAIQALPRQSEDTAPPMKMGCTGVAPTSPRGDEERGRATRGDLSCPHLERSSTPLGPRGLGLGRSSAFFRYRNHSSFVDGRDARLLTGRLPSERDQRIPRHASASSAAAAPLEARQGRMQRGLVQTRSCPRSTDQTVERLPDWTSGPSCTWSKRRSRP